MCAYGKIKIGWTCDVRLIIYLVARNQAGPVNLVKGRAEITAHLIGLWQVVANLKSL
jgi:hypothetical protein